MADFKYKGLEFPFKKSQNGNLVDLTTTEKNRIKSNLQFLITTNKRQRWMRPKFGLNLQQYFFEPLTDLIVQTIKSEIIESVSLYLPSVKIEGVDILEDESNRFLGLTLKFKIINGLTSTTDITTITF